MNFDVGLVCILLPSDDNSFKNNGENSDEVYDMTSRSLSVERSIHYQTKMKIQGDILLDDIEVGP